MKFILWRLGVGAIACALMGSFASAEDSVDGVVAAPAGEVSASGSRGDFLNEIDHIRQETRSQRDITNLRIEQMEREVERSTGYMQNMMLAFLIAAGIVVFLVLNTIRHQGRANTYRMRQLIRDSERALAEIERHVQRPEYDHFQTARRLDRVMNYVREHERSMPQKMITDVYAAVDDPTLPVSLHYQANALKCEQAADWRQAISFWERLHKMDDGNPEVLLHLANCYKGLAEVTPGPEASVYRDTSLRFFQFYTQRNRNLQQLQENIASPQAPPAAPEVSLPRPAAAPPAAIPSKEESSVRTAAAPPVASPSREDDPVQTAAPPVASVPPAAASSSNEDGIVKAAGRAVRGQVSMVGESASKLGSSFRRVGVTVASGIYDRVKSTQATGESAQPPQEEKEEPVYVPERQQVEMPPINYYREESSEAAKPAPDVPAKQAEKPPASLKLAATAVPPPPVLPARQTDDSAAADKPAQVFAAPTIKQTAKKPPVATKAASASAEAPKNAKPAVAKQKGAAKANGSGQPADRKPARKRAKMNSTRRFGEYMQAAGQARQRVNTAGSKEEKITHLQEVVSHYEAAAKFSSSLSMYRLWGSALIDQARLVADEEAASLLAAAVEKFRQGEKIKLGAMSAELAQAYALVGDEDECRQAVKLCLKNGTENLDKCFGSDAFDRYRSADWFVSAQEKIAA